jgi:hypothetical protein
VKQDDELERRLLEVDRLTLAQESSCHHRSLAFLNKTKRARTEPSAATKVQPNILPSFTKVALTVMGSLANVLHVS